MAKKSAGPKPAPAAATAGSAVMEAGEYEVVLPEDFQAELGVLDENPDPNKAEEKPGAEAAEGEPKAEGEEEPPAPKKPEQEKLSPAAREEREKRKKWRGTAMTLLDRVGQLQSRLAEVTAGPVSVPPYPKQRIEDLKKKATAAEDIGPVVEMLLAEVDQRIQEHRVAHKVEDFQTWVARDEARYRRLHKDYDQVIKDAGVLDAVQIRNGRYVNPEIAAEIYGSESPAETAYGIAQETLRLRSGEAGPEEAEVPVTPSSPKPKLPKKAEAEQPVVEEEPSAPTRPRSISKIPSAGGPAVRRTFTRDDLDRLRDRNLPAFTKLMESDKRLERWYYGDEGALGE